MTLVSESVVGYSAQHASRPERRIWIPILFLHDTRACYLYYSKLLPTHYSLTCTLSEKTAGRTDYAPEDPLKIYSLIIGTLDKGSKGTDPTCSSPIFKNAQLGLENALFLSFSVYLSITLALKLLLLALDVFLFFYFLYTINLSSCMHTRYCNTILYRLMFAITINKCLQMTGMFSGTLQDSSATTIQSITSLFSFRTVSRSIQPTDKDTQTLSQTS